MMSIKEKLELFRPENQNYYCTPQDTDEWLTVRRLIGTFTGSQLASIMLPSRESFKSRYDCLKEMYKEKKEIEEKNVMLKNTLSSIPALKHGTLNEDNAIHHGLVDIVAKFPKFQYKYITRHGFKLHDKNPLIGGSVDGILHCRNGELYVIEAKCPFYNNQEPHSYISKKYALQLEVNCRVWGIKQALFISASFIPGRDPKNPIYKGAKTYVYKVNDRLWAKIQGYCDYTYTTYVKDSILPPKRFTNSLEAASPYDCPMNDRDWQEIDIGKNITLLTDTFIPADLLH